MVYRPTGWLGCRSFQLKKMTKSRDFADLYSRLRRVLLATQGYFLDKRPLQKHGKLPKGLRI